MKHTVDAWANVARDPLSPAKVWITFYPPAELAQGIAEEQGISFKRAVRWIWQHGNRVPTDIFAEWESEEAHSFAYEWLTVKEADAYIASFTDHGHS